MFEQTLPSTNDAVAATAPTNSRVLIAINITNTITENSIIVASVIGAVKFL
jgi:hypothetical protein